MSISAITPEKRPDQSKCSVERKSDGGTDFPASVGLMNTPGFKEKVVLRLKSNLQRKANAQDYRLLVDVYRRSGEFGLAIETLKCWQQKDLFDQRALHLLQVLSQQRPDVTPYSGRDLQPAPFTIINNFLSESEREDLLRRAITSENEFAPASVLVGEKNIVDKDERDTHVLFLTPEESRVFLTKLEAQLQGVFTLFQLEHKTVKKIEIKSSVHKQGGFFKIHHDGFCHIRGSERCISWVYYFHQRPKVYTGGDLALFDSTTEEENHCYSPLHYTRHIPGDNQLIFFPSSYYHCVTPVHLSNSDFSGCRFALSGHIRC